MFDVDAVGEGLTQECSDRAVGMVENCAAEMGTFIWRHGGMAESFTCIKIGAMASLSTAAVLWGIVRQMHHHR